MRRCWRRVAAAAAAVAIGVCAHNSPAAAQDTVLGRWQGHVEQIGATERYAVLLTLSEHGGETDYPELECGGELDKIGERRGYVFYYETITRGRYDPGTGKGCIDGTTTVVRDGAKLIWGWIGASGGSPVIAYATLDPLQ